MADPAISYDFELIGNDALIRLLIAAGDGAGPAMERGLYEEGQLAFRGSQAQVPYRFGILKGSGRLFPPQADGAGNVEVVLGYGGNAKKYAVHVHEIDKNYRNGKKRHYLIDPVNERINGLDNRLAKRIDAILRENR